VHCSPAHFTALFVFNPCLIQTSQLAHFTALFVFNPCLIQTSRLAYSKVDTEANQQEQQLGAVDESFLPWWQRQHKQSAPPKKPNARQLKELLLSRDQVSG